MFKWLSITAVLPICASDGLLLTVNAHCNDSVCIDAKSTTQENVGLKVFFEDSGISGFSKPHGA